MFTLSSQMPLGEGDTGSGFQVAFERDCSSLLWELDHHIDDPRPVLGRMDTTARVVLGLPPREVGGVTSVIVESRRF